MQQLIAWQGQRIPSGMLHQLLQGLYAARQGRRRLGQGVQQLQLALNIPRILHRLQRQQTNADMSQNFGGLLLSQSSCAGFANLFGQHTHGSRVQAPQQEWRWAIPKGRQLINRAQKALPIGATHFRPLQIVTTGRIRRGTNTEKQKQYRQITNSQFEANTPSPKLLYTTNNDVSASGHASFPSEPEVAGSVEQELRTSLRQYNGLRTPSQTPIQATGRHRG